MLHHTSCPADLCQHVAQVFVHLLALYESLLRGERVEGGRREEGGEEIDWRGKEGGRRGREGRGGEGRKEEDRGRGREE